DDALVAACTVELLLQERARAAEAAASGDPGSPWARADGWRLGHAGKRQLAFLARGERIVATAQGADGEYRIARENGPAVTVSGGQLSDGILEARFDGTGRRFRVYADPGRLVVHDGDRRTPFAPVQVYRRDNDTSAAQDDRVRAPMPGRVVVVRIREGDQVVAGQELVVIEAMKMELALKAPRDGVVEGIPVAAGDFVEADAVLVALER
ncbi:MAG TPA: biotin/lipoyl-containing protein, partial [Luteimonas sp.]|nr:biotin/lipoyl-containing protein [Luteimonas sp.]